MNQRRIDPTLYVQAADAFDAIASSSDRIGRSASSSASGFARMAGDDPGGEQFASAYDELAGHALQNIFDIGIRANGFDRLFMASGANAAAAEAFAAGRPFDAGAFPLRDARQPMNVAPPPSAYGGSGSEPEGWQVVKDFIGMMWPNADTDQLDAAATAWERIAADVRNLATEVRRGDDSVASLNSAELVRARAEVSDFAGDIGQLADLIEEVGGQCSAYASDVRDAHNEVIQMLVQLAVEIAASVAIGAALSVFTFGVGGAAAAGAMAVRIAAVGGRIVAILIRVGGTAARVATRIRAIRASLIPFATRFRRPTQAVINMVSGTTAAVGSEIVVRRGDANVLVAFGSGLVGGAVSEAIVARFGRYGHQVVTHTIAGGVGGVAGGATDGLLSDGSVDIRQVIISGVGGAGLGGFGARSGSRRNSSTMAAEPGTTGHAAVGGGRPPVLAGTRPGGASAAGGRTGTTDYDGPVVAASDVSGAGGGGRTGTTDYEGPTVTGSDVTGGGGGGASAGRTDYDGPTVTGGSDAAGPAAAGSGPVRVPQGEAPQAPSIEVTPPAAGGGPNPVDLPAAPSGAGGGSGAPGAGGTGAGDGLPSAPVGGSGAGDGLPSAPVGGSGSGAGDGLPTPPPASGTDGADVPAPSGGRGGDDVPVRAGGDDTPAGAGGDDTPAGAGGDAPGRPVSSGGGADADTTPTGSRGADDGADGPRTDAESDAGTPRTGADEADTPLFHETEQDLGMDIDGDGVIGSPDAAQSGAGTAGHGSDVGASATGGDGSASPGVPPHTGLSEPPTHTGADAPPLPRAELDRINSLYRLPSGEVDPARLDEWAKAVSDVYPALTPEQVRGIYHYTTDPGYEEMNAYLRNLADKAPADVTGLETQIAHATQGLANLPAEPSLGRSYSRGVRMFPEFLDQFQRGERWSDPSFMSASDDPSVAEAFAEKARLTGETPGIITIDAQTPASISPLSRYQYESEFLFQRGTEFDVISKYQDDDGIWHIHLREVVR